MRFINPEAYFLYIYSFIIYRSIQTFRPDNALKESLIRVVSALDTGNLIKSL